MARCQPMPPRPSDAFPSAPQAAVLLLAGFFIQYLVTAGLYDAREALGLSYEQLSTLATVLGNGVLLAAVLHIRKSGYRDLLHPGGRASPVSTFMLLVPPVLLLVPLIVMLDGVLMVALEALYPLSAWEEEAFRGMSAPSLAALLATCVIAPVVEEMLFRGVLLRGFLQRYPRGLAIGSSALFFGVAHFNIYQFCLAFMLGILLGWLFERSRSLIPCIALHAGVNTAVTVLSWPGEADTASQDPTLTAWAMATVAAALGAAALWRLLAKHPVLPDAGPASEPAGD